MSRTGAALLLGALSAACADGGGAPNTDLASLALPSAGSGYAVPKGGPDGPLSNRAAVAATPADGAVLTPLLAATDHLATYERVFANGSEFVTVILFAFTSTTAAAQFEDAALRSIASRGTADVRTGGAAPGERVFQYAGSARGSSTTEFCQGSWFAALSTAVEVLHCGADRPADALVVTTLADQQYERLRTAGLQDSVTSS